MTNRTMQLRRGTSKDILNTKFDPREIVYIIDEDKVKVFTNEKVLEEFDFDTEEKIREFAANTKLFHEVNINSTHSFPFIQDISDYNISNVAEVVLTDDLTTLVIGPSGKSYKIAPNFQLKFVALRNGISIRVLIVFIDLWGNKIL